MVREDLIKF